MNNARRLAKNQLAQLPAKAYPDGPQVIVDGDDWRGQLVVRAEDVEALLCRLNHASLDASDPTWPLPPGASND